MIKVRIGMHDQGPRNDPAPPIPSESYFPSKNGIQGLSGLTWVHNTLTYFRFPKLSLNPGLVHGVFTRHKGMSAPPYDTLNTSLAVGDRQEDVIVNLQKIKETMHADHLIFMDQAHGEGILVLRKGDFDEVDEVPTADAIITDIPRIAIMVKQADCQGVIIFDPKKAVVANVHCGWRGNVKDILGRVIAKMEEALGCMRSDLLAAIGPSLGPCCAEFVGHAKIFPRYFKRFMGRRNYFDLWAISCWQLVNSGVRLGNIEVAGICTRCRTDLFYSYRGEGRTGRFATVAMLTY